MREPKRVTPAQAEALLRKKWDTHHANWGVSPPGADGWPLTFVLHNLTEKDVFGSLSATREWVQAWRSWRARGCSVEWAGRRWASGNQELPDRLVVPSPEAAADLLGQRTAWERGKQRCARICGEFPQLAGSRAIARRWDEVLAGYSEPDIERLLNLLRWLTENPRSGLYLRQLPVFDVDTKWVESRRGAVGDFVRQVMGAPEISTFHEACGLLTEPARLRIRILCPQLRAQVGGLSDIEAPVSEIAALPIRPTTCLIVENKETGIALPDVPEAVAFMRLGLAVEQLEPVEWIRAANRHLYWGDLDTHGFVALARARRRFPGIRSVLMDQATLLANQSRWVREDNPSRAQAPDGLTPHESAMYDGIRTNRWGEQIRLEQERLPWPTALQALAAALAQVEHA